jgi:hypothetical protein
VEHIPYIAFFVIFTFAKAFNTLIPSFGLSALVSVYKDVRFLRARTFEQGTGAFV